MRILVLSAAFVFATIGVVRADPPAPAAAPIDGWEHHDPNETVCVRPAPPTGSFIMPKPECHTRAEWRQIREAKDNQFAHGSVDVRMDRDTTAAQLPGGQ
jgi:hypothetical protein